MVRRVSSSCLGPTWLGIWKNAYAGGRTVPSHRLAARLQVSDRRPAPRITSNVKHNLRVLKFWKVQQGVSLLHQSLLSVSTAEICYLLRLALTNREHMW
jgi:hypothetical protein